MTRQFTSLLGWIKFFKGSTRIHNDPHFLGPKSKKYHFYLNFHSTYLHIVSEEAPGATKFLITQIVLLCIVQDLGSCSGPKGEVATVSNARLPNVPLEVTRLAFPADPRGSSWAAPM